MKILNQNDYAGKKFGKFAKSDMAKFGCKLFSLHYMYRVTTGKEISIYDFDKMLVKGGCYFGTGGDMLDDAMVAKTLGWEYFGKETNIAKMPTWSPTIKEVDASIADGKQQHFVVRIIKEDGSKAILDPLGGTEKLVNYYERLVGELNWEKGKFSYRLFKAPNQIKEEDMDYTKNLYKIFFAVCKFLKINAGENPNDDETKEIEKELEKKKENAEMIPKVEYEKLQKEKEQLDKQFTLLNKDYEEIFEQLRQIREILK